MDVTATRRLVPLAVLAVLVVLVAGSAALGLAQAPAGSKPTLGWARTRPVTTPTAPITTAPSRPDLQFPPPGPDQFGPAAASFIDANQGWVLKWNGCDSCAALAETHNGGLTWSALPPLAVPMGFAHSTPASVTDLYFAGRENGFLFGPGLEVTHDGGQTWQSGSLPEVTEVTGATGYV